MGNIFFFFSYLVLLASIIVFRKLYPLQKVTQTAPKFYYLRWFLIFRRNTVDYIYASVLLKMPMLFEYLL